MTLEIWKCTSRSCNYETRSIIPMWGCPQCGAQLSRGASVYDSDVATKSTTEQHRRDQAERILSRVKSWQRPDYGQNYSGPLSSVECRDLFAYQALTAVTWNPYAETPKTKLTRPAIKPVRAITTKEALKMVKKKIEELDPENIKAQAKLEALEERTRAAIDKVKELYRAREKAALVVAGIDRDIENYLSQVGQNATLATVGS